MTYKDAYDKIIQAYFEDEIRPMEAEFCFCGTLTGGDTWCNMFKFPNNLPYSKGEYVKMEAALLTPLTKIGVRRIGSGRGSWVEGLGDDLCERRNYENHLFEGMCAALEVLKEIHRRRGENVDEVKLTKRVLTT